MFSDCIIWILTKINIVHVNSHLPLRRKFENFKGQYQIKKNIIIVRVDGGGGDISWTGRSWIPVLFQYFYSPMLKHSSRVWYTTPPPHPFWETTERRR